MRKLSTVAAAVAAAATAAPLAQADDPAPLPPTSAVSQYIEQLPSAQGPVSVDRGGTPAPQKAAPLAPAVRAAITRSGGSEQGLLRQVATNPSYGAPATASAKPRKAPRKSDVTPRNGTRSVATTAERPAPHAVAAAASTAADGAGFWPLALVLVAVTAAGAALKLRRG